MPSLLMKPSRTEPIPSSPSPKKKPSGGGPPPVISGAQRLRPRSLLPQPRSTSPPASLAPPSGTSLGRSISGSFRKSFGVSPKAKDKDVPSGRRSAEWELVEEDTADAGSSSGNQADQSSLGRSYGSKGKQRERRDSQIPLSASTSGISRLATFSRSRTSKVTASPSPSKKTRPLPPTSPTRTTASTSSRGRTSSAIASPAKSRPAPLGTPAPPSAFSSQLANVPGTPNSPSPMTRSNSGSLLFVPPPSAGSDVVDKSAMNRSVSNPVAKKDGAGGGGGTRASSTSAIPLSRPSSSSDKDKENKATTSSLLPSAPIRASTSSTTTKPALNHRPKSSSPQTHTTSASTSRPFPASASIASIPAPPPPAAAARRGHKVSLSMSVAPSASPSSSIPVVAPRGTGGLPRPTTAGRGTLVPSTSSSSKLSAPKAGGLMPFPVEKDAGGVGLKRAGSLGRASGVAGLRQQMMPRSPLSLIGGEMARPAKAMGTPARKDEEDGSVAEAKTESDADAGLPSRQSLSYPSPAAPSMSTSTSTPHPHPHPSNPLLSFSQSSASASAHSPFLTPSSQTRSTPKLAPRSSLFDYDSMRAAAALPEDASLLIEDLDPEWSLQSTGLDTPGGPTSPPERTRPRSSTSGSASESSTQHRRRSSARREGSDVFTPPPPPVPVMLDRAPSHIPISTVHLGPVIPPSPTTTEISLASLQSRLTQSLLAQGDLSKALASSKGRILELEAHSSSVDPAWEEEKISLERELDVTREVVISLEGRVAELESTLDSLRTAHDMELAKTEEESFVRLDEMVREARVWEGKVRDLERERRERVGEGWEECVRREKEEGDLLAEEKMLLGLMGRGLFADLERRVGFA